MMNFEIDFRTNWNDPSRINCFMAEKVMLFYVIEVYCLLNSGLLVKIASISMQCRIVKDPSQVCFKV